MKKNFKMKSVFLILGIMWISFNQNKESQLNAQNQNKSKFQELKDPYLSQKPPGMKAEIFAPSVISTTESKEFASTFSPDGNEFYFTRSQNRKQRIWHTEQKKGVWTIPELAPFAFDCSEFEPHISPDGNKLYFSSQRPKAGNNTFK